MAAAAWRTRRRAASTRLRRRGLLEDAAEPAEHEALEPSPLLRLALASTAAASRGRALADEGDPYPALVLSEVHQATERYEDAIAAADDALATRDLPGAHAAEAYQHKVWALLALDR